MTLDTAFEKLARSKFRSRFKLTEADRKYITATWLFGEKARLRTLWAFAVSAINCVGMVLTI